jgi:hypothetical protein
MKINPQHMIIALIYGESQLTKGTFLGTVINTATSFWAFEHLTHLLVFKDTYFRVEETGE